MSKKQPAAREHARQRAMRVLHERRRREHRNRLLLRVGAPVLVVILVVGVMLAVKLGGSQETTDAGPTASTTAPDTVVSAVSSVPAAAFDAVGAGQADKVLSRIHGDALAVNGLPRVVYIGAEYCPYCAAERWPVVVALSRFGTFTDLASTHSAAEDVYPNTATLSFHGATYASKYLAFSGYEIQSNTRQGNTYAPLDTVPAADEKLLHTYNPSGSIPFMDIGNRYLLTGATFDPTVMAGLTHEQIAAQLSDPSSASATSVLGTANVLTAAFCDLTGQQPSSVCTSAGVTAAAGKVPPS